MNMRPALSKAMAGLAGLMAMAPAWALAQPQIGDLLVTVDSSMEVIEVSAGGDMSNVAPFATGLQDPAGICRGPNDDIYVAEWGDDNVMVITDGGVFAGVSPFATGLEEPVKLFCTSSQVLVSETGLTRRVVDVTAGGHFPGGINGDEGFAHGFDASLRDLLIHAGAIYLSDRDDPPAIWNISAGGDFSAATPFATDAAAPDGINSLVMFQGVLYAGESNSGRVVATGGGGNLAGVAPFAILGSGVADMESAGDQHLWVLTVDGEVFDVAAGGDFTNAVPFAHGLGSTPISDLLYYHGCGDGIVWADGGETCDDGNTDSNDGCDAICQSEGAGGSGAGGGGGTGGSGTGGSGTAGSGTAGSGTGGSGTGATGTGTGTGTDTAPGADATDDGGCSCRVAGRSLGAEGLWGMALLAGAVLARRRRPC